MTELLPEKVRQIVLEEGLNNNRLNEAMLAAKLGVSRTPIREVLQHLEEEGLIDRRPKIGIGLRVPSVNELSDIFELRSVLEGLACRKLAVNAGADTIQELEDACRNVDSLRETEPTASGKVRQAEIAFHEKIVTGCGNNYLWRVYRNCQVLILTFRLANKLGVDLRIRPIKHTHEMILAALRSNDPVQAEKMAIAHIEEGRENILMQFGNGMK